MFVEQGESALDEIKNIHTRLTELLKQAESNFPLSEAEAADFRVRLRDLVLEISAVEQKAVDSLQRAMM